MDHRRPNWWQQNWRSVIGTTVAIGAIGGLMTHLAIRQHQTIGLQKEIASAYTNQTHVPQTNSERLRFGSLAARMQLEPKHVRALHEVAEGTGYTASLGTHADSLDNEQHANAYDMLETLFGRMEKRDGRAQVQQGWIDNLRLRLVHDGRSGTSFKKTISDTRMNKRQAGIKFLEALNQSKNPVVLDALERAWKAETGEIQRKELEQFRERLRDTGHLSSRLMRSLAQPRPGEMVSAFSWRQREGTARAVAARERFAHRDFHVRRT